MTLELDALSRWRVAIQGRQAPATLSEPPFAGITSDVTRNPLTCLKVIVPKEAERAETAPLGYQAFADNRHDRL